MKTRYFFLLAWFAISGFMMLSIMSDFCFGDRTWKTTRRRLLYALVWPFLMLSAKGRNLIIRNNGGDA